jgi:hypothetical protein
VFYTLREAGDLECSGDVCSRFNTDGVKMALESATLNGHLAKAKCSKDHPPVKSKIISTFTDPIT